MDRTTFLVRTTSRGAILSAFLGLTLLASACDSTEPSSPSTTVADAPRPGGSFSEGLVAPASLEPALASTVSERILADQMYDGLTRWDPSTLLPQQSLAKSWSANADNTEWTFVLRDDAVAANGDPITPADVKKSIEHVARSGAVSPSADLVAPIKGAIAYARDASVSDISGIVAGDKDVRISTDSPYVELPTLMANQMMSVVHVASDGSNVSTGPYKVRNQSDALISMEKAPNSVGLVDSINAALYPNVDQAYAAFDHGDLDWAPVPAAQAQAAADKYGRTNFTQSLRTIYLSINLANPKFGDPRFRQAILQAIDRPSAAKALTGDAQPLNGIVPSAVPQSQGGNCGTACTYDPSAAKSLLAAVFPDGNVPTVDVALSDATPMNEAVRAQLEANLRAADIPATVRLVPAASYDDFPADPNREVFQTSWTAAYPSYEAFLAPLFASSSQSNVVQLHDAATDKALVDAQATQDNATRLGLYKTTEASLLSKQFAVIPIATFPFDFVAKPGVRGVRVLPLGNFDPTGVWLAR